jgi:hypothetical protein
VDQFSTFNSIGSEYCKNRIDSMSQEVPDGRRRLSASRFISLIVHAKWHPHLPADPPNGNGRALAY